MAHPQDPFPGLAHDRERLDEQFVDGCAAGQPLAELDRLGSQLFVGEGGGCGFERVDALSGLPQPDYFTLVAVEERLEESHTDV